MELFSELEWTLENISCWNEKLHGGSIMSPDFKSSLCFHLYPRGEGGQEECMEVDIVSRCGPHPSGELSFLCSDGSIIHSQQAGNPDKIARIRVRGPRLEEVLSLIEEKEGDRLTLLYRFKSEEEYEQKLRTVIDVIDNIFQIDQDALGCGKELSYFTLQTTTDYSWASLTSVRNSNVIQLKIKWSGTKDVILVKTCLSFLKIGDVLEKYEEKEHVFRGHSENWGFFSINQREFAEMGATVLLRLKFITGSIHSDPSLRTNGVSIVPNKCVCFPEKKPSESPVVTSDNSVAVLTKDFMCLFQDQDFSDLELNCGGMSFPVHKNVLSARCPVFKRLLRSDMREAASGSVDVEDLDAPTLSRFLAFLYTGAVGEDLQADSVLKLYYAADKYQVPTLKKECGKFLGANTSVTNICDILSLADKHGDDQLTEVSRRFILENYHQVSASENWKSFIKKEPELATHTLADLCGEILVKRRRCN